MPCLLALLPACEAQVSPAYRGEALLTLSGSVEIDSDRERGPLIPALAFLDSQTSEFHIMDVEVEGEFPSDFTLRVYEPPPAAAILEDAERPPSAFGYIAAVTEDHPAQVRFALAGAGAASCLYSDSLDADPIDCEFHEQWCTSDQSECYTEVRSCPAFDSPVEDCEILESSGDPSLREDPWANFAGLSDSYRVVYLQERLEADAPISRALGLPSLQAGYHLFRVRPNTDDEQREVDACREQANTMAVERYNAEHGTDYAPEALWGVCGNMAPMADPVPGTDPEPAPEPTPVPECLPTDVVEEIEQLNETILIELACAPDGEHVELVENPEEERISVRIAADVQPF